MKLVCGNPTCAASLHIIGGRQRSSDQIVAASLDPSAVGHAEAVRVIAALGWRRHSVWPGDPDDGDVRWVCGRCAD